MDFNDKIILTYKSCSIKQSDLQCLSNYQYINDIIISFYYEILKEQFNCDKITLLDPAVTMSIIFQNNLQDIKECIFDPLDLSSKDFVFAPINDNEKMEYQTLGSHWALCLFDVNNNKIYYFDSMLRQIDNIFKLHKRAEKLFKKKFAIEEPIEKTYQNNSFDCGMFVLSFSETLLKFIKENNYNSQCLEDADFDKIFSKEEKMKQMNMESFRKEIYRIIKKKIDEKKK